MYKYEGRTEDNINEILQGIQNDINDVFNNINDNESTLNDYDNETMKANLGETRNNGVLLKTKRTKHKKRQVNKHFLNFDEKVDKKITDEDAEKMLKDDILTLNANDVINM